MRKQMDSEQDAQGLVFFINMTIEEHRKCIAETHHSYEDGSSGL
jgi:hypothetical protein